MDAGPPADPDGPPVPVQGSVDPQTAAALQGIMAYRGWTADQALTHAVGALRLLMTAEVEGKRLFVRNPDGQTEREILLAD